MNNYFDNPSYRKAFFNDTDRIMAGFNKDFGLLQADTGNMGALKNIHRYAHSLKGLSAMMELKECEQIATNLESSVGQVLKNDAGGPDVNNLSDIKNGFNKLEELLRRIRDDTRPAAV